MHKENWANGFTFACHADRQKWYPPRRHKWYVTARTRAKSQLKHCSLHLQRQMQNLPVFRKFCGICAEKSKKMGDCAARRAENPSKRVRARLTENDKKFNFPGESTIFDTQISTFANIRCLCSLKEPIPQVPHKSDEHNVQSEKHETSRMTVTWDTVCACARNAGRSQRHESSSTDKVRIATTTFKCLA